MNCANHPDREKTAFCQNCGKPLCQECTRVVGTAVFCEPCLAARLSGVGAPPPPAPGPYPYSADPSAAYIPPAGTPNPALAALLGMIPGVGAMYNGQFAKGIVHLVIFAILVSLSHENGIFGLFIAGWVCYQVIEAYHTARARRDGTPLPNPFGLNDLGERLGFGKSWSAGPTSTTTSAPPPAATYTPPANPYASSATAHPPPPRAPWDAQWTDYASPAANPYITQPVPPIDPNVAYPRNRFPMGAIWLIGLGVLFLIGNSGFLHELPMHRIIPFFLIGLGVWLFIHKMTLSGPSISDDGSPYYRVRLISALRGSIWVILVGFMFLLSSFRILSWGRSWPLFIIVGGLMTFFERTALGSARPAMYPPPPPSTTAPPASAAGPIVPSSPTAPDQQEER